MLELAVVGLGHKVLGEEIWGHREVIASLLAPWIAQRPVADLASAFAGTSVLWARYRSFTELASDPEVTANPLLREIDQPGVGRLLAPGTPLAQPGVGAVQPAPLLGADTVAVLTELLDMPAETAALLTGRGTAGAPP